jgi:hypothetical protein
LPLGRPLGRTGPLAHLDDGLDFILPLRHTVPSAHDEPVVTVVLAQEQTVPVRESIGVAVGLDCVGVKRVRSVKSKA